MSADTHPTRVGGAKEGVKKLQARLGVLFAQMRNDVVDPSMVGFGWSQGRKILSLRFRMPK